MTITPGRPARNPGGTNAVNSTTGRAAQPLYVGSGEAIAAAYAGRDVLMRRAYLDDGTAVVHVSLPRYAPQPADRYQPAAPAGGSPQRPRQFVEYRPHPSAREYRRPGRLAFLTTGQRTMVIAGAVVTVVLLALAAVLWVLTAVAAVFAAYGAMILSFVVVVVVIGILASSGGGSGGSTNVVSITAKTVGRITFK